MNIRFIFLLSLMFGLVFGLSVQEANPEVESFPAGYGRTLFV